MDRCFREFFIDVHESLPGPGFGAVPEFAGFLSGDEAEVEEVIEDFVGIDVGGYEELLVEEPAVHVQDAWNLSIEPFVKTKSEHTVYGNALDLSWVGCCVCGSED